ncbi:MAG: hypothetical protein ACJ735_11130 [Actinomycetes bacterium]
MAELDDARLRGAMRTFLDACDALDAASSLSDGDRSREFLDSADAKTLAEMILRQQLERLGWTAPREVAPVDNGD